MNGATDARQAVRFIMRLAAALHRYGTPAHRLEAALAAVAGELGVVGQFLVTPTSITAAFDIEDGQESRLLRINSGETNLEKLSQLNEVMSRVIARQLDVARGIDEIGRIVDAPPRYGSELVIPAFIVISASAGVLFGGGTAEVLASLLLGAMVGALSVHAAPRPRLTRVLPALAALLASVLAALLTEPLTDLYPFISTLGALIVLIPGLALTIAMNELANGHLVSGSARLVYALLVFLQMGLGLAGGAILVSALGFGSVASEPVPPPLWMLGLAIPVASLGFTILFQARPVDAWWIALACVLAFVSARLGHQLGGSVFAAAFGAWTLGCVANLVARLRGQPSVIMLLPGLLMLVPGSIGFRSVEALTRSDVISGIEAGFLMSMTAMALVTGLLLANLTIDSRRSL